MREDFRGFSTGIKEHERWVSANFPDREVCINHGWFALTMDKSPFSNTLDNCVHTLFIAVCVPLSLLNA